MRKNTLLILLLLYCSSYLFAQSTINGKVTDSKTLEPLAEVSVTVKNTTIGTSTDSEGFYSLKIPEKGEVLVFSFIGMIGREVEIGQQNEINIALSQDTLLVDEVVITAIGIPREKKALGYSVQELSSQEITVVPHNNVINSLTGKVAGVQVTSTSGSPGASAYITIRGAASIAGDNQPLFVVDGVPVSNGALWTGAAGAETTSRITDLNPEDIHSMSVLKGGAATALYGIRAANGAIIITTKGGRKTEGNNVNVSFSSTITFDRVSQLPELQTKYGQGLNGDWSSGSSTSWGPRLDSCSYTKDPNLWTYPDYDVDGAIVSNNSEFASGDPVNIYNPHEFFQTGVSTNNLLSFSGGSDKALYYNSISYTHINGVVPNSNWKRFNLKVGGEANLSDKFKILGSITYLKTGGDRMQKGDNWSGVMLGLTRTPPSFDNAAGYELPDGSQRNYRHGSGYDNPYWTVNKNLFKDDVNRVMGFVGFNWFVAKWFQVSYKLGADYYNIYYKNYYAIGSNEWANGAVYLYSLNRMDINSDLILQFQHRFNEHWETRLKLGQNLYEKQTNGIDALARRLELPGFYHLSNSSDVTPGQWSAQLRRAGVFGDFEVSYNKMIYLNLTGRNDWSTTLPEDNNSFFYPSASLGWIFTELNFLKGNRIFPFGKIRFSVAQIASDPDWYKTKTGYTRTHVRDNYTDGLTFPLMRQTGFTLSDDLGNPELEPEKTTSWEIGADLKFLSNRIAIDFTYFNNYSDGLLMPVGLSGASGYMWVELNAAGMSSKGIETVLYGNPLQKQDWAWDFFFNFTKIKNIVENIPDYLDFFGIGWYEPWVVAKEGYPYQSFFGYDWFKDEHGNVLIDDDPESNNYGFPLGHDTDSMVYLGKVNPDWVLGWTNNLKWKNLTFSFLLEYKYGGNISNETRGTLYGYGAHKDTEGREPGDEVIFEGVKASDGSVNDIEVIKGQDWYYSGQGSAQSGNYSSYIEDAGWIRLREIALNYSFGKKILGRGFVKSLNVYFAGKNLWLRTEYSGIDPETSLHGNSNLQGIDLYNMPGTKSYTIGLRVTF